MNGCLRERRIVYICSLLWGGPGPNNIRVFYASIGSKQGKLLRFLLPLLYRFRSLGLISGREAWNNGMRVGLGDGCIIVGLLE